MNKEGQLEQLLVDLFSPAEFRRWVSSAVDREVIYAFPSGPMPMRELIHEAVASLQRRGLLNDQFFTELAAERPHRIADINLMKVRWFDQQRHFLLNPCGTIEHIRNARNNLNFAGEFWSSCNAVFPPDCICVALESDFGNGPVADDIAGAVFDIAAYKTLLDLIDDLFVSYLSDRFSPLTYGKEWILVKQCIGWGFPAQVLAPWSWLQSWNQGSYSIDRKWAVQSISDSGIQGGDRLEVATLRGERFASSFCSIAVRSKELHELITTDPKARMIAFRKALEPVAVERIA